MSPDPAADLAKAMMEISNLMTPIGEAVDGYKADCERRGYSPTAAETMALDFHHFLMAQILAGLKSQ